MSTIADSHRAPLPLVIDCDPGIDDAVSLALAVGSPELDLRAVTTVSGNVPVGQATANALGLLQAFGRDDVPVAAGAATGLVRARPDHPLVHGRNGLGGVEVAPARRPPEPCHAVELLARVLGEATARSVTIAAIGPLTNIALLVALHPELLERVARLVIMGGSAGSGNITPVAEFNTWADPEAAQRVLGVPALEICMVGLDVTRRATVDEHVLGQLRRGSRRGALLTQIIGGYADRAPDGWPLHDVLAVASVVEPGLLRTRAARVAVDTSFGIGRAQTICSFERPLMAGQPDTDGAGTTQVAFDLDRERFRELLLERVAAGG